MYLFLKIKTKQLVSQTTLFYKESALIAKKDNKFIKEYYFMAQFWECPANFADILQLITLLIFGSTFPY